MRNADKELPAHVSLTLTRCQSKIPLSSLTRFLREGGFWIVTPLKCCSPKILTMAVELLHRHFIILAVTVISDVNISSREGSSWTQAKSCELY